MYYDEVQLLSISTIIYRLICDIALEHIPNSVRLWKKTVNLETSPADAHLLLSRAVEVIPLSVELWLALSRLKMPESAKAVLTSRKIWIAAGRLIEQEACAVELSEEKCTEELDRVDKTLATAVRTLRAHCVFLTREQWLKEAERCEGEGAPRTCEAIISASMDVEEEDHFPTWLGDAEAADALVLRALCSRSRYAYSPTAATFGTARLI